MAISSYPPAVPKRSVVTLTSGTSWTVPSGVTQVSVVLFGGGGGSGGVTANFSDATSGGTGGTTTFTGATSASGGAGSSAANDSRGTGILQLTARSGNANTGNGAFGAARYLQSSGYEFYYQSNTAQNGQVISSTLSTTPAASISYAIGAGGTAGSGGADGTAGAAGGSGKIEIEYWV
jgi:hypothetical protein